VSRLKDEFRGRVVFKELDISKPDGQSALKTYKVLGPPHFLILDAQGEVIASLPGFQEYDALRAAIAKALAMR
jgi:thiol:disulfide interchange protein